MQDRETIIKHIMEIVNKLSEEQLDVLYTFIKAFANRNE